MSQLTDRDLRSVLDFVHEARSFPDLDSFRTGILPGLLRLVPAEIVGYNEVDTDRGGTVVVADPAESIFDGVEELLARLAHQNPLVARVGAGDLSTCMISDFLSEAEFHRLEIYQDMYRRVGTEDQIAFGLPREQVVGIAINRSRRTFTERDRAVLELLRPHLAQAYAHVRDHELAVGLLAALECGLEEVGAAVMLADAAGGTIGHAGAMAREVLVAYFGPAFATSSGLPAELVEWLEARPDGHATEPLAFDGERGRLRVRELPAAALAGRLLLLDEVRCAPPPVSALERLGLSRREAEVLRLVAIGKDNGAIAAELFIAVGTVRKHLEHIYARLGVSTRTAAAARAHAVR